MLTLILGVALGTMLGGLLGTIFVMIMFTNKRFLKFYTRKTMQISTELAEELFKVDEETEEA